jgi:type IV secretion system protein VirB5
MDIQARVGVENAHIQNDALQLQALRMRQESQRRLAITARKRSDLATKLARLIRARCTGRAGFDVSVAA